MSKIRGNRKLVKVLQMVGAFLLGIFISQMFGNSFCGLRTEEKIDEHNYLMVVLILTAPKNIERRNAIRETWLNLRPKQLNGSDYQKNIIFIPASRTRDGFLEFENVQRQQLSLSEYQKWLASHQNIPNIKVPNIKIKHLFAVGKQGLGTSILKELDTENRVYNDLLFLDDLQDSYKNLTRKLIQSMNKLNRTTPNFKYLLKCDDDTYVKLDLLTQELIQYDQKRTATINQHTSPSLELYWGYFNGRANIKKAGQWQESNYNLCDRYMPYALGGAYVLSNNLVTYIASHGDILSAYGSEDISVGTWLAPFNNVHRRHDVRFDTGYQPRKCKNYHLALHKRTSEDMRAIAKGDLCASEVTYDLTKQPVEYFYDWSQSPSKCCDNRI